MRAAMILAAVVAASSVTPALAQDSATLLGLHDKRREGSRYCLIGHFHHGAGSGSSKRAALQAAVNDWAGFTQFEYGVYWGQWRWAKNKTKSCSQGASGWSCSVEARPCRRYYIRRARR